jgi:hypothetical protein
MQRFQIFSNTLVSFAKTLTPKNPRSVKPIGEGRRLFRASAGSPAFLIWPSGHPKQCGYFPQPYCPRLTFIAWGFPPRNAASVGNGAGRRRFDSHQQL